MTQPRYLRNAGLFRSDVSTYEIVPAGADVMMYDEVEPADAWKIDPVTASLRNELARYTYKPGAVLTIEPPRWRADNPTRSSHFIRMYDDLPRLRIEMRVPDSRNVTPEEPTRLELGADGKYQPATTRKLIPISLERVIPEELTTREWFTREERSERFAWFLREVLEQFELHEMCEWWRRDGELVDDPHARATPSKVGPIAP
jgi:hypothetical protein